VAALFLATAINGALYHRTTSGEGMLIDVAMLDAQVAVLENAIARYAATGNVPGPLGARHPSITPFDAFAAADGYLVVAAGNDALFRRLCTVLDRADLADNPLFATNDLRTVHQAALKDEMESVLRLHPVEHWLTALEEAGIPSGPINTVDKVLADPQVRSRNMVVSTKIRCGAADDGWQPDQALGLPGSQGANAGSGPGRRPREHPGHARVRLYGSVVRNLRPSSWQTSCVT